MTESSSLKRTLAMPHYLAIGVGSIIGVGWVIVVGDWLERAGPLGAILAFVAGGVVMALVAACYSELATSLPHAGGEVVYAYVLFGPKLAFIVGWFLVLTATATASFEAVSFAQLLTIVFPALDGPALYHALGSPVTLDSLLLGLGAAAVIAGVNLRGVNASAGLQAGFTLIKASAVVIFIAAGLVWGSAGNLQPLVRAGAPQSWWIGALWIAATAPFWFGGFQIIVQVIEERSAHTSPRAVGRAAVLSVVIGTVFYCLVVFATAMAAPRDALIAAELPAAHAMQVLFGSALATKLALLAIILGIAATWNGCMIWATRMLLAQGRAGFVPAALCRTRAQSGTPANAILFVSAVSAVGVFFGRSILLPVVNMGAISLAVVYVCCCLGVLRLRRRSPAGTAASGVAGGRSLVIATTLAAAGMAGFILFEPLTRSHGHVPIEWILLALWGFAGIVFWRFRAQREEADLLQGQAPHTAVEIRRDS